MLHREKVSFSFDHESTRLSLIGKNVDGRGSARQSTNLVLFAIHGNQPVPKENLQEILGIYDLLDIVGLQGISNGVGTAENKDLLIQ